MRFFWSYHPDYWEGLRQRGFLRGEIGVRLVQSPWEGDASKFNRAAEAGSPLHRLIHENGYGLLVDRGVGGCPYHRYEFDPKLLDAYANRLGDRLLGVQLHEWMGWVGHMAAAILKQGPDALLHSPAIGDMFDESGLGTAQEYARRFPLADTNAFVAEATALYRLMARRFGGQVNLVDSGAQSYYQGLRLGARHVMPELGNQTPLSRLQVAYARGMARAFGKPWGVYYECWGGSPFSVTCYTGTTLWRMPGQAGIGEGEGIRHGGAGGSGRSLQRRLLLFSWLSGAMNFAEEWGDSNTFHDWTRYELTPYGQVIADYLDLADAVPTGEPATPVALVIDPSSTPLETSLLAGWISKRFRLFPLTEQDVTLRPWLTALFWPADPPTVGHHPTRGNDWFNLTNTPWPDAFDIVPADAPQTAFDRYGALLYLGDDEATLKSRLGRYRGQWISREGGLDPTLMRLRDWLRAHLPVWVDGDCQWTLNQCGRDWLLAVFNNEGVHRTAAGGETTCDALTREVRLTFAGGAAELNEIATTTGTAGQRLASNLKSGTGQTVVMQPGQVRLWSFR
jgi:hypothetical protein